jgi:hypothetical protein
LSAGEGATQTWGRVTPAQCRNCIALVWKTDQKLSIQIYRVNVMSSLGTTLKASTIWRVACLIPAILACSCSRPAPVPPSSAAAVPAVSYDGHYEGTVAVSAVSFGTDPQTCAVEPRFALDVSNNGFVYVQPHPKIAGTAPGLTAEKTTVTYNGSIAPDGTISGTSVNYNGTMTGHVTGTRMSGQIGGVLCSYTFTADRV